MTSQTPLIAHLVYRFGIGGLENGVVNLINNMPNDKYRHAIICATDYNSDFVKRIKRDDVEIYALNKKPGNDFSAQYRLWKLLRQIRPDIVHTRNFGTIEYTVPAMLAGVRYRVHGEHGRDLLDIDGSNRKYRLLRRFYSVFINHFVAMSQDLQQWLINDVGIKANKIHQLYNGVDSSRFTKNVDTNLAESIGLTPKTQVVGTVGRLQGEKDQQTLIEAFKLLTQNSAMQGQDIRLLLVGDGPEESRLKALVETLSLQANVVFLGARSDIPQVMALFDLFVLPSLGEGISNTILEAMASGLPVIATRVGGNQELVLEGETGRLVPAGESGQMAQAMLDYLLEPETMLSHAESGRQRVCDVFSLEAMVARYTAFYDSLFKQKITAAEPAGDNNL